MEQTTMQEPALPEVTMHACRQGNPAIATVTRSERCTASRKSAGIVRHIEFDVAGTPLEGICLPGQSVGVLAPGEDEKGRPHAVRLYSLASPTRGEDGEGRILSTTVKRTIDEHWETHRLFLGVASNYLCDVQVGDELRLTGPAGKRFLLPTTHDDHDYVFFSTGTGIAPFRGMLLDLLAGTGTSRITLISGAPYATDLLYHDELSALANTHDRFTYLTAVSREDGGDGRVYVQDRLRTHADLLRPMLESERTLVYVCGVAGMEIGILQECARMLPADALAQYLRADADALADIDAWDRRMLHRALKCTRRMLLEVYA